MTENENSKIIIHADIKQAAKEKNAADIRIQMKKLSSYLDCVEVVYD